MRAGPQAEMIHLAPFIPERVDLLPTLFLAIGAQSFLPDLAAATRRETAFPIQQSGKATARWSSPIGTVDVQKGAFLLSDQPSLKPGKMLLRSTCICKRPVVWRLLLQMVRNKVAYSGIAKCIWKSVLVGKTDERP